MKTKPQDVPFCGVRRDKVLNAKPVLNAKNLARLYSFIQRRYRVHFKKDVLGLPPPWTQDPILQEYRFTNIRREHDRETKWLIERITSNPALSYEDKLLNCVLFRLYNKHETSELIGMPIRFEANCWDPDSYRTRFETARQQNPHAVFFTGAFITGGMKRALKWYLPEEYGKKDSTEMRVLWFMKYLLDLNLPEDIKACKNQQEVFELLSGFLGIGEFLGYQIFVDMTYIKEFPFSENEFTVAGPGCKRGIDYLFSNRGGMTYEECLFWMRDNLNRAFKQVLGKELDLDKLMQDLAPEDRVFNVMSLENCMCELSKYIRAVEGTGRPRQKYKSKENKP